MTGLAVRSPKLEARVAGGLYLLVILLGGFAEVGVREGLVVSGDPSATAAAILGHAGLFRMGFAAEALTNLIAIPITVIVYRLLRPVGPGLALVAIVFDLTQNTVNAVNEWTQFAPLTLLQQSSGGPGELAAIPEAERAAWARLMLHWHDVGFDVALSFFGVALVLYAVLIVRSRFLPSWLGALYGLAGASYVLNSALYFLAPGVDPGPMLLLICLIGEAALALWLLVMGVDEARWRALESAD